MRNSTLLPGFASLVFTHFMQGERGACCHPMRNSTVLPCFASLVFTHFMRDGSQIKASPPPPRALTFPFRRITAAGIAKAESPGGEIADAAGADGLSGDAPAEVERERLDETDGKAAVLAVEPEALTVSENLVKCVDRSDAIGAALEEAFIVPAATASPPASGPSPPCFGIPLPDFLTDRKQRLAEAFLRAPTSSRSPLPSATNRW